MHLPPLKHTVIYMDVQSRGFIRSRQPANSAGYSPGYAAYNVDKLAVFIKSEMLREVRENCFCKYQRYPIITIESQNKTIMTDKRQNDVIVNYTITNILVTQLELSLQCPPKLLLWFVISFVFAKRSSATMGSSLFVTLVGD